MSRLLFFLYGIRVMEGPQYVEFAYYGAQPGDDDYVEANHGGCWFCSRDADSLDTFNELVFDTEFDTNVHLKCIRRALRDPIEMRRHEAEIMSYLLK